MTRCLDRIPDHTKKATLSSLIVTASLLLFCAIYWGMLRFASSGSTIEHPTPAMYSVLIIGLLAGCFSPIWVETVRWFVDRLW